MLAEPGVSDKEVLGQSVALSGPAKELGSEMRSGALLYFEQVNASGGVHGRRIRLQTLDDGYEPERTTANTRKLIEEEKVLALFGYVGTPTSLAALPPVYGSEGALRRRVPPVRAGPARAVQPLRLPMCAPPISTKPRRSSSS